MPAPDVDALERLSTGYIARQIALASSYVNSRLRKRYGNAGNVNALPLGRNPPALQAAGSAPPGVALQGRPSLGSLEIRIEIETPGGYGVGTFRWSADGGLTWQQSGVTLAPSVVFGTTGMTAIFPPGPYGTDHVYQAATPVPEAVLGWIVRMVTFQAYNRRGRNMQDPALGDVVKDRDEALADLKEAADSNTGLFDLPVNEDADSAVTTGGPLAYTETSPYVWADQQRHVGRQEDHNRRGSS